jgi:hypothetical protein
MYTPAPGRRDDLSDVERRVAGWRPASAGLGSDATLYAAGLAAGRRGRGRRLWPALCLVLAIQSVGLGIWGLSERAGRRALAGRLAEPSPAPGAPPAPAGVAPPESSPDGYYHLLRQTEQDPNRWLVSLPSATPRTPLPAPPEPAILRAGQLDSLSDL